MCEIGISLRGFDDSIRHAYGKSFPGDPDKTDELLDWRFRQKSEVWSPRKETASLD